ncbi:MAG: glutathione S-transferase family protein [Neomegalonema sp.]|nr:glutathione S-transferase family protein [Neomegalonema sp.]
MTTLYHLPFSPFCRKIRLVLSEKRIEAALVEEKPWERRRDFLVLNPAGLVPVLRLSEPALTLADSTAIAEYLDETHPEPPLMPQDPVERAEVRRLVGWFDGKFHAEVTANLLYERLYKKMKNSGYPEGPRVRAGMNNIKLHLDYIAWLAERRTWLAGERMSLADLAAAAHLSSLDYMGDVPWDHAEPAKDWYLKIKSRPSFRDLLADRVIGLPPVKHYTELDF